MKSYSKKTTIRLSDTSNKKVSKLKQNAIAIMEAAKSNFLLRGYFKKKKRAEEKKKAEAKKAAKKAAEVKK